METRFSHWAPRGRFLVLAVVWAGGCAEPRNSAVDARILGVDTITAARGLTLFKPVEVASDGHGGVFILDAGNSELYRVRADGAVDTLATKGSGPRELLEPSTFALQGDSSVIIVDSGNGRIQWLDLRSGAVTTLPFTLGAQSAVVDPAGHTLVAATYAQNFALQGSRPVLRSDSLVSIISLRDGSLLTEFGTARPYEGTTIPLVGNYIRVATHPATGDIWLAWPLEPVMMRYSANGTFIEEIERDLLFTPPPPSEYRTPRSPLPAADVQQVTYDLKFDATGNLLVLTAVAPKTTRLGSDEYRVPAQAVEVLNADMEVVCRVRLPFAATDFAIEKSGSLLFTDLIGSADVYRLRYECPD
ncbi:MAG TPA: hypothetical protein VF158_09145 [Longimicrobiales bacterium]